VRDDRFVKSAADRSGKSATFPLPAGRQLLPCRDHWCLVLPADGNRTAQKGLGRAVAAGHNLIAFNDSAAANRRLAARGGACRSHQDSTSRRSLPLMPQVRIAVHWGAGAVVTHQAHRRGTGMDLAWLGFVGGWLVFALVSARFCGKARPCLLHALERVRHDQLTALL